MIGLVKLLQKRPTDMSIRLFRILFGLLISGGAYYSLIYMGGKLEEDIFWVPIVNFEIYVKYFYVSLGIVPIIMGITNICLLKTKHMRILQIIVAFIIFLASENIESGAGLGVGELFLLLGFIPLFAGITGKCITSKCLRYKEVINKIRV